MLKRPVASFQGFSANESSQKSRPPTLQGHPLGMGEENCPPPPGSPPGEACGGPWDDAWDGTGRDSVEVECTLTDLLSSSPSPTTQSVGLSIVHSFPTAIEKASSLNHNAGLAPLRGTPLPSMSRPSLNPAI